MGEHRNTTHAVAVGNVTIGGGAPVAVQSMTDTDTTDTRKTSEQILALADAGAELVRITVDTKTAAQAVAEIRKRLDDTGCSIPLIGDFHFNGHALLREHPACAHALDKYRINPGNVGSGDRRDPNFEAISRMARENGKAIRIGVNGASLDPDLVTSMMERNARRSLALTSRQVMDEVAVASVLSSIDAATAAGLADDRIIVSCKVSSPPDLIRLYRRLSRETSQPLHLGLTEAGRGIRGMVWSAASMGTLLADGIGDTIRVSLTPRPGGDRRDEVRAARELLQALGLRSFDPTVTSCPGCGRTTGEIFQKLAERVESHLTRRMPAWQPDHPGVERLRVAVMGCIVNGPGESRSADIGISLPGRGEKPRCPVYVDGAHTTTVSGNADEIATQFIDIIDNYVATTYR